ncbi:hypothetical protein Mia14_0382 [Candidatus Mancarchaeum acidiphilum]|uniref:Uncharacterized protein n=1 Tax=Candidatus Mancarchaeum acidiphilum TaxID=1920749 RepID=A0A218NMK4_9ARCH|nr:hypothetical protein [Candidatus Mancarchaeum acidiphilum]ASI13704.1 hypothetical protein Mia14_0382 [Candidatus Mancarchaeum acidiphilum]
MDKRVERNYESEYSKSISIDAYMKVINLEYVRDSDSIDNRVSHSGRNMDLLVKMLNRVNKKPKPQNQNQNGNKNLLRGNFSSNPYVNLSLARTGVIKSMGVYDDYYSRDDPEKYFYLHSDIADGIIYKVLNREELSAKEAKKVESISKYILDEGIISLSGKKYLVLKYNYDDSIQLIGLTKNEKVPVDKIETDDGKLLDASPLHIITIDFSDRHTLFMSSDDLIYANKNNLPKNLYYMDEHDDFEGNSIDYDFISELGNRRTAMFDVNFSREMHYGGRMNPEIAEKVANFIKSHDKFIYDF